MGYYVSCKGTIWVGSGQQDMDLVARHIDNSCIFEVLEANMDENILTIRALSDSRYHEDKLFELYKNIKPWIVNAYFCVELKSF